MRCQVQRIFQASQVCNKLSRREMASHLLCELSKTRRSLRQINFFSRRSALPLELSYQLKRNIRAINSHL